MYNDKIIEEFNEYLRDNFDAIEMYGHEFCADEILRLNLELYSKQLKEFIDNRNYFGGIDDQVDEWGYPIKPNEPYDNEEIF